MKDFPWRWALMVVFSLPVLIYLSIEGSVEQTVLWLIGMSIFYVMFK